MRVLLVSPVFHGYWSAIAAALRTCGHEVITHCYDAGSSAARVGNALAHRLRPLAPWVAARATARAIMVLRKARPDAVLVVKGDMLGQDWWDALVQAPARVAVWLYDELARMTYTTETLRVADAVFSYSPYDTAQLRERGLDARHLPDGYDALTRFTPHPAEGVITLIGARYPGRERALQELQVRGIRVAAYGRDWSRHPWDILRTRRWRGAGIPSHRDVARAEYYGIMAGGLATLNAHGDGHDGFSMRTFEAPGVGALQLIDRPDVAAHYDVGTEVLVYESDAELIEHAQRARRDEAWARGIREAGRRRTLAEHTLVHRMTEVQRVWA